MNRYDAVNRIATQKASCSKILRSAHIMITSDRNYVPKLPSSRDLDDVNINVFANSSRITELAVYQ